MILFASTLGVSDSTKNFLFCVKIAGLTRFPQHWLKKVKGVGCNALSRVLALVNFPKIVDL